MKSTVESTKVRSPAPARLDLAQSLTGLALALFMWTHLVLVSSILLGKDAMWFVTRLMEARFLTAGGTGYPVIVTIIGIVVFALFIVHAGIALRKFPASWKQYRVLRDQMGMMKHTDTNLWFIQFVTGFVLFFLASVHIYVMTTHPGQIGPYASSDRFVSEVMWPLYLLLLLAVELHATIGMYRLAGKWGVFDGKDPRATRRRPKKLKNGRTAFFLVIGLLTCPVSAQTRVARRVGAGRARRRRGGRGGEGRRSTGEQPAGRYSGARPPPPRGSACSRTETTQTRLPRPITAIFG